jgi:hypothetical protein
MQETLEIYSEARHRFLRDHPTEPFLEAANEAVGFALLDSPDV